VAERLDEAARQAGGVSCLCPDDADEGDVQAEEDPENDDGDGSSGVPARVR